MQRFAGSRAQGFDHRWLILIVTGIGSFMTLLDSTIVNVALPGIIQDFHSDVARGQFVVTIYLLALAVVIPVSGFLGEKAGMKRLYMVLLSAFALSSGLCAVAWSMPSLVVFRALQGLGGGMLQPVGMAIVYSMIAPLERGRFMVMLGLPILLAPLLGPTVGGYLAQYVSWRAIFLINLPIGLVDLVLAYYLLKATPPQKSSRLDTRGFVLSVIAFPAILFSLSAASDSGWNSPFVLLLLLVGLIALGCFIAVELRQDEPMLQLRLFAHPMFSIAIVITFVTQFFYFGSAFLLPLFLQNARGFGPAETGLILFPSAILDFVGINLSGKLYNRLGPRPFAISGVATYVFTAIALSRLNATTGALAIAVIASLRGLGIGLCMMPVMTMAFNTVPQALIPRATALQNVLQRVFGSASTAVLTTVLIFSLGLHGAPAGSSVTSGTASSDYLVRAFSDAFIAMALIAAVGMPFALRVHDDVLKKHQQGGHGSVAIELEAEG